MPHPIDQHPIKKRGVVPKSCGVVVEREGPPIKVSRARPDSPAHIRIGQRTIDFHWFYRRDGGIFSCLCLYMFGFQCEAQRCQSDSDEEGKPNRETSVVNAKCFHVSKPPCGTNYHLRVMTIT